MMRFSKKNFFKTILMVLGIYFYILILPVAAAEGDMDNQGIPIMKTVSFDANAKERDILGIDIKRGEGIKVELCAASGTGYQWVLLNEDLKLVEIANHFTDSAAEPPNMPGGKMRTVYILQAKSDSVGQETVIFSLRRVWEPANMAAKTVRFHIKVTKE